MQIFFSYSRSNAATVQLLSHVLGEHGFNCTYDRSIVVGATFDETIREFIEAADLVVPMITADSLDSVWFNQEVGYAIALGKLIFPLRACPDIDMSKTGMLARFHGHAFDGSGDIGDSVPELVKAIQDALDPKAIDKYHRSRGLPRRVRGLEARTRVLITSLEQAIDENQPLTVCCQAAFSSFAISNTEAYRQGEPPYFDNPDEHMRLLVRERELMTKLCGQPNVTFQLLVWPPPAPHSDFVIKYRGLLDWMEQYERDKRVSYAVGSYFGTNRVIIQGQCAIESTHNPLRGYAETVVYYDAKSVNKIVQEFKHLFSSARQSAAALAEIRNRIKQCERSPANDKARQ